MRNQRRWKYSAVRRPVAVTVSLSDTERGEFAVGQLVVVQKIDTPCDTLIKFI